MNKAFFKKTLRAVLPTRFPAIVVASMGRSGSTVVYSAIRDGLAEQRFHHLPSNIASRIVSDSAWDLASTKLQKGVVYKTHAHSHELSATPYAKVVFLYGSASDAALSVFACNQKYGPAWTARHFDHMRAKGSFADLPFEDVLRFGEQLDGWLGCPSVPTLGINYEELWTHEERISEFVGFPIRLPRRRSRSNKHMIPEAIRCQVESSYASLDRRISDLPGALIVSGGRAQGL